jgi:uncharacterized repeat protein (TIGR01451 family)
MHHTRARRHFLRWSFGLLAWLVLAVSVMAHGAWLGGGGIALTAASRQAIVDRIAGGEAPLSVGDVISVIADFPVITAGTLDGPGGYATIYVPPGTEVVSTYITDAAGTPVDARPAQASTGSGVSKGWGPKGQQVFDISPEGWNPSDTTQCQAAGYSIADCNAGLAYIYGDTGIFYSTRADTALFANGAPIATLENGYLVNPTNGTPWSSVGGSGTARVHNKWDAVQINAFGSGGDIDPNGFTVTEETTITGGRGATPFRAGSPVAGPDSGTDWDRYGTTGPWNRISYPGSCRADDPLLAGPDGPATGAGSVFPETLDPGVNTVVACTDTTEGFALNDSAATALPAATNAVRYAFGGIAEGETYYAVMDLRVTDLSQLGYINAEGHGGDSAEGASAGNDNPWRYWVAGSSAISPAGPEDLHINISITAVNGVPYSGGDIPQGATLTYRVSYVNTSLSPMTNVQTQVTLPPEIAGTSNFRVVEGEDIRPAGTPGPGSFALGTMATLDGLGSGAIEFDAALTSAATGTVTASAANSSSEGGADSDSVTAAITAAPVAVMPICTGERFSLVDWGSDAPAAIGIPSAFSRYGVSGTITASSNASPLRPAAIGTGNELYASAYGGATVLSQQYARVEVAFDTPMSAIRFYATSLDLDESVTIHGELGGVRVQPALADGPISAPMRRVANADGSVSGERDSTFSTAALPENFAVLVGFGQPVDRIVITHDTRQANGANFAGAMQLTDVQACADFTDAPSAYGDALHAAGATATFRLGDTVTGDAGPGNDANAGSDDDDGVEIPPLVQGFLATVETQVTGAGGRLSGWIDYNGNGVLEEGTAEEVALDLADDGTGADAAAGDGVISFEVIVPGDAVLDQTFARFRWSSASTLGITAPAPDGEVEDYPINIAAAPLVDRGDAPASYGDPLHIISDAGVSGTYLGAIPPDPEAASQASPDASGDDLDGNDDEDGVIMPGLFAGGTSEITVTVNEVTGGAGTLTGGVAYLSAWIDFAGDGVFDASDRIAADLRDGEAGDKDGAFNGEIKFDVAVPADATLLPTFARFRFSTTEGMVTVALDGEVEDYQITVSNDDPPVVCDNGLYQIATKDSTLKRMRFGQGPSGYTLNLETLGTTNNNVNAGWGYNELDGYIYGVRSGKGELWRVDGTGTFTRLVDIPNTAADGSNAGDILPNGTMVYKIDQSTWQLLDLSDPTAPVDLGTLNLTQPVNTVDFASNPIDGVIYGINSTTDRLFRASANGGLPGTTVVVEFGPAIYTGTYGAVFFDENGRMYAYDNNTNIIYLIDTTTGSRQFLAESVQDEGGINDGASCRGPSPVPLSGLGGNIYVDQNASDVKEASETNLGGGIRIDIYTDNGTPNDLTDDSFVATADTDADGTYAFTGLPAASTYRLEVDVTDPDLPSGSQIGTSNPIVGARPDSSGIAVDYDFGFDPQFSDLSITKSAFQAGTTSPVTTAAPGDMIDWVVEVTNDGPGSPSNVRVIEKIPTGFAYVSDDAPATGDFYDPETGLWFVDEILSGATERLTVRVRVLETGSHINEVEIIESSLPDLDSDPASGTSIDDLGDGRADDDEARVEITLEIGTRLLSGRLILDDGRNGGTAHDGVRNGGETGTQAGTLRLLDAGGALLASPEIAADGRWSYALDDSYTGTLTLSVTPAVDWIAVSEAPGAAPGLDNPNPHDGTFTFTPAPGTDHAGLDLGLVAAPTLSEDRTASLGAGQTTLLPHLYRAGSPGNVRFEITDIEQSPADAFSVTPFLDTDCDGTPETPLNDPVPVAASQELCLLSRVVSGSGLPPGASLVYQLIATTTLEATAVAHVAQDRDRVTVEVGGGQLVLVKTVRNLTQATEEGASNRAAPGDVLAYRIELINPSQAHATDIRVYDQTPPYTQLSEPVPSPVAVGPSLTCSITAPSTNTAGYAGPLRWDCAGSHAPGDRGSVSFAVRIE